MNSVGVVRNLVIGVQILVHFSTLKQNLFVPTWLKG
jgi:hypothetical protein